MKEKSTASNILFTRTDYLSIKEIFQRLIDNQITEEEFKELLNENHVILPSFFFSLSLEQKKKYIQLETVWVDPVTLEKKVQFVWNANYFYELVQKAKKSQTATTWLMEYCRYLDCRPIYFLTMQNIKIRNIAYFKTYHPNILEYAKKKKISTLYALLMDAFQGNCDKIIQAEVLYFFKKESNELFFDVDYFPNTFALEFERLLYSLNDEKLANDVRVLFLIYKKEYLNYNNLNISTLTIKKFLQKVGTKSLSLFLKYAKKHDRDITKMAPNGYQAFYYSVLFQKEKPL